MGKLIQMPHTVQSAEFTYEPNDVELRGAAHLLARAAVRLDEKYFSATDSAWESQAHLDAFQILSILADNHSSYMVLRALGGAEAESIQ